MGTVLFDNLRKGSTSEKGQVLFGDCQKNSERETVPFRSTFRASFGLHLVQGMSSDMKYVPALGTNTVIITI